MAITIDLPPTVESQLRTRFDDLGAVAKLGLAIEAYRAGELSLGQFAELLDVSQYEADGILKQRGVELQLTPEELAEQRRLLEVLLGQ